MFLYHEVVFEGKNLSITKKRQMYEESVNQWFWTGILTQLRYHKYWSLNRLRRKVEEAEREQQTRASTAKKTGRNNTDILNNFAAPVEEVSARTVSVPLPQELQEEFGTTGAAAELEESTDEEAALHEDFMQDFFQEEDPEEVRRRERKKRKKRKRREKELLLQRRREQELDEVFTGGNMLFPTSAGGLGVTTAAAVTATGLVSSSGQNSTRGGVLGFQDGDDDVDMLAEPGRTEGNMLLPGEDKNKQILLQPHQPADLHDDESEKQELAALRDKMQKSFDGVEDAKRMKLAGAETAEVKNLLVGGATTGTGTHVDSVDRQLHDPSEDVGMMNAEKENTDALPEFLEEELSKERSKPGDRTNRSSTSSASSTSSEEMNSSPRSQEDSFPGQEGDSFPKKRRVMRVVTLKEGSTLVDDYDNLEANDSGKRKKKVLVSYQYIFDDNIDKYLQLRDMDRKKKFERPFLELQKLPMFKDLHLQQVGNGNSMYPQMATGEQATTLARTTSGPANMSSSQAVRFPNQQTPGTMTSSFAEGAAAAGSTTGFAPQPQGSSQQQFLSGTAAAAEVPYPDPLGGTFSSETTAALLRAAALPAVRAREKADFECAERIDGSKADVPRDQRYVKRRERGEEKRKQKLVEKEEQRKRGNHAWQLSRYQKKTWLRNLQLKFPTNTKWLGKPGKEAQWQDARALRAAAAAAAEKEDLHKAGGAGGTRSTTGRKNSTHNFIGKEVPPGQTSSSALPFAVEQQAMLNRAAARTGRTRTDSGLIQLKKHYQERSDVEDEISLSGQHLRQETDGKDAEKRFDPGSRFEGDDNLAMDGPFHHADSTMQRKYSERKYSSSFNNLEEVYGNEDLLTAGGHIQEGGEQNYGSLFPAHGGFAGAGAPGLVLPQQELQGSSSQQQFFGSSSASSADVHLRQAGGNVDSFGIFGAPQTQVQVNNPMMNLDEINAGHPQAGSFNFYSRAPDEVGDKMEDNEAENSSASSSDAKDRAFYKAMRGAGREGGRR
ncbi:unnamed protein product [Amoebophrya sp. A120]|nr:unnamed protein product [Amoebophrya sp. A120]|eukprot:GSA120T00005914001.1